MTILYKTKKTATINTEKSLTQQSMANEADINRIVKKYNPEEIVGNRKPKFGDFSEIPTDLQDILQLAQQAKDSFALIPPEIRLRFNNDPAYFYQELQKPENNEQFKEWGILAPEPVKLPSLGDEITAGILAAQAAQKTSQEAQKTS